MSTTDAGTLFGATSDLLPLVLTHLDSRTLIACTQVSRTFAAASSTAAIWAPHLLNWCHGTLSHLSVPELFSKDLDHALPSSLPLPRNPKAIFRVRTLLDQLALKALATWARETSEQVRSACIDTISTLGLLVCEQVARCVLVSPERCPGEYLAVRAAAGRLLPVMERALVLDGWRNVGGYGEKGTVSVDWVARSFAPFSGESDLWAVEALDEALGSLAIACMLAFEQERADSGEPDLSASAIASSVWNTLKAAGITASDDSYSSSGCFISLVLSAAPDSPKVLPEITMATLIYSIFLRLQGPHALKTEIYLRGVVRVGVALADDPNSEWFYIDAVQGHVRTKESVERVHDAKVSDGKLPKADVEDSRQPATSKQVLEEMACMLWRGGAPEALGAPATMTARDFSVAVLSIVSLFSPETPTYIKLPVPLVDALRLCDQPAFAADLWRFQAHLLDFAGHQDQRAELLDGMAERMRARVEPIVGEISQGVNRQDKDVLALEFKAGDVCWIEEEGAVGVVVPWAVLENTGTSSSEIASGPTYVLIKSNGFGAPASIVRADPSQVSRVEETHDWPTALRELESSSYALGLHFRAKDFDSNSPRYLKTGFRKEMYPED